ncbi:MAG TPA: hypothetical protein VF984_14395 [Actinomycetota bacterium]
MGGNRAKSWGVMAVDWEQRVDYERLDQAGDVAHKIRVELAERGLERDPVGADVTEIPVLRALESHRNGARRAAEAARGAHAVVAVDAGEDGEA